ncbi:MAG: type II toxin-antitoxin system RelE/ParE family toxin [Magnetococcales bacterium]|nr:type II toxin-antitoxin system RelE/ParE family toxin [Magnetococcales bacterium]
MSWRVIIDSSAQKELDALDKKTRERVAAALFRLKNNPFSASNVKALAGGGYRLRVGNYRILYTMKNEILLILVFKIAHRGKVYR